MQTKGQGCECGDENLVRGSKNVNIRTQQKNRSGINWNGENSYLRN